MANAGLMAQGSPGFAVPGVSDVQVEMAIQDMCTTGPGVVPTAVQDDSQDEGGAAWPLGPFPDDAADQFD